MRKPAGRPATPSTIPVSDEPKKFSATLVNPNRVEQDVAASDGVDLVPVRDGIDLPESLI